MSKPDYEVYARELAQMITPLVESCKELRKQIKFNIDANGELNWKNVEAVFYKFEDQLNKFLGE